MKATLIERLAKVGWHFEGELLERAMALLHRRGKRPEHMSDIELMTLVVEAYRKPEPAEQQSWI